MKNLRVSIHIVPSLLAGIFLSVCPAFANQAADLLRPKAADPESLSRFLGGKPEAAQDGADREALNRLGEIQEEQIGILFPSRRTPYLIPDYARALYQTSERARRLYQEASSVSGYSIERLLTVGDRKDAALYRVASTLYAIALYEALEERLGQPFRPKFLAGSSVGTVAAMVASGALPLEDAVTYGMKTAPILEELSAQADYAMFTVLSAQVGDVSEWIEPGRMELVIDASPAYLVLAVSGNLDFKALKDEMTQKTGRRIRSQYPPLLKAPHTSFYAAGQESVAQVVDTLTIRPPKIPIVSASSKGKILTDAEGVRRELKEGLFQPVLWSDALHYMAENGIEAFLEFNSGMNDAHFNQTLLPGKTTINVDRVDLAQAVSETIWLARNDPGAQDGGRRHFPSINDPGALGFLERKLAGREEQYGEGVNTPNQLKYGSHPDEYFLNWAYRMERKLGMRILPRGRRARGSLNTLADWQREIAKRLQDGKGITVKNMKKEYGGELLDILYQIEKTRGIQLLFRHQGSRPGFGPFSAKVSHRLWVLYGPSSEKTGRSPEAGREIAMAFEQRPWWERLILLSLLQDHNLLRKPTGRFLMTPEGRHLLQDLKIEVIKQLAPTIVRRSDTSHVVQVNRLLALLKVMPESRGEILKEIEKDERLRTEWEKFIQTEFGEKVSHALGAKGLSIGAGDKEPSSFREIKLRDQERLLEYLRENRKPVTVRQATEALGHKSERMVEELVRGINLTQGPMILRTPTGSLMLQKDSSHDGGSRRYPLPENPSAVEAAKTALAERAQKGWSNDANAIQRGEHPDRPLYNLILALEREAREKGKELPLMSRKKERRPPRFQRGRYYPSPDDAGALSFVKKELKARTKKGLPNHPSGLYRGKGADDSLYRLARTLERKENIRLLPRKRVVYRDWEGPDALKKVKGELKKRTKKGWSNFPHELQRGEHPDNGLYRKAAALEEGLGIQILPRERQRRPLATLENWRTYLDRRIAEGKAITHSSVKKSVSSEYLRQLYQFERRDGIRLVLRRRSALPNFNEVSKELGALFWNASDSDHSFSPNRARAIQTYLVSFPWHHRLMLLFAFRENDRFQKQTEAFLRTKEGKTVLSGLKEEVMKEVGPMVSWRSHRVSMPANRVLAWTVISPNGAEEILEEIRKDENLLRGWKHLLQADRGKKLSQAFLKAGAKPAEVLLLSTEEEEVVSALSGAVLPLPPSRLAEEVYGGLLHGNVASVEGVVSRLSAKGVPIGKTERGSFYLIGSRADPNKKEDKASKDGGKNASVSFLSALRNSPQKVLLTFP